jgi:transcription initiation factor TFIIIB Brf1 subunit/transcription initiation factor TFIIB
MPRLNDKKQQTALDLFLYTDKTQKEIAEILDVSEKTISKWAASENWDELKGASSVTAAKIVTKLYKKLDELADADKLDTDALIKTARTIEALTDNRVTIPQTINAFKEFTSWLFTKDSELAKMINDKQMDYIRELASK